MDELVVKCGSGKGHQEDPGEAVQAAEQVVMAINDGHVCSLLMLWETVLRKAGRSGNDES